MNTFDVYGPDGSLLGTNVPMADVAKLLKGGGGSTKVHHPTSARKSEEPKADAPRERPKFYAVISINDSTDEGHVYVGWDAAKPHIDGKAVWHHMFKVPAQADAWLAEKRLERETAKLNAVVAKPSVQAAKGIPDEPRHLQRLLDGEAGYRDFASGDDSPPWDVEPFEA